MMPTAFDVSAFLGIPGDTATVALSERHLSTVVQQVKAYTRDRGFVAGEPGEDIAAVIVSATARSISNPETLQSKQTGIDDATVTERYGVYNGWTLPELAILHRYRKRAL